MTQTFSEAMRRLRSDMTELAMATGCLGWDKGDSEELLVDPTNLGAKPIPRNVWDSAFLVAMTLCIACPQAGAPIAGAHPEGFVCLTWDGGEAKRIDLQLRKDALAWTQRNEGGERAFTSQNLHDVALSLRAVFRAVS